MDTEKQKVLMAFDRRGNMGILFYGEEDSEEYTWEKRVVIYRKPKVRSKREFMSEQKRLLKLDVFDDIQSHHIANN